MYLIKTIKGDITKAYNLPCGYVIHTVGPIWNDGRNREEELLANCCHGVGTHEIVVSHQCIYHAGFI